MTKIFDNRPEPDYAVLVGVGVNRIIHETSLDELSALCKTCNIIESARVIQNRKDIDVTWYVGKGKVDEIKVLAAETGANVVVFDVELSGSKTRNLEQVLGMPVLDRSKIILDIFARRAQSMEGKLQVELAQLKYNSTRLVGAGGLMAQMRNSVGMRGPGEKKLELDKRTIRDQILTLEQKLRDVKSNRELSKQNAVRSKKPRVCLVGYTNSGKSTLLNAIAKTAVLAEDKLFATLDPKTANVYLGRGAQILLTDTVGFIDKLPHEFIKAFESTLDEARFADLLLHVVDASNSECQKQIEVVNQVLAKIGADKVPTIMVFNKSDILNINNKDGAKISALKGTGIDLLKQKIIDTLAGGKI